MLITTSAYSGPPPPQQQQQHHQHQQYQQQQQQQQQQQNAQLELKKRHRDAMSLLDQAQSSEFLSACRHEILRQEIIRRANALPKKTVTAVLLAPSKRR